MPNIQFSVPSGMYLEIGKLADETDMSPEQYAKYGLWYLLTAGISPEQVREAKRDFERRGKNGEKIMHKPRPLAGY